MHPKNFQVLKILILSSTHKYNPDCGHASFWNYLPFTLKYKEDNINYPEQTQSVLKHRFKTNKPVKRIACSNVTHF